MNDTDPISDNFTWRLTIFQVVQYFTHWTYYETFQSRIQYNERLANSQQGRVIPVLVSAAVERT